MGASKANTDQSQMRDTGNGNDLLGIIIFTGLYTAMASREIRNYSRNKSPTNYYFNGDFLGIAP